ncbi:hypothetical protein PR202_gb04063 [Eleusine coracana subsp. coracana]|uniref:Uncharacterized protein n=1 Tax=Eleusine coracana subsp. coracana TaxID=191504 RepID=A0AAV5E3K8_ELECO|nr:hypothetical protein PR202_gb04063 [Eleusine coracana subsp. coracana]
MTGLGNSDGLVHANSSRERAVFCRTGTDLLLHRAVPDRAGAGLRQALGADQFAPSHSDSDPSAHASRSSFFNWYYFAIAWGYAVSLVALSYVEDNVDWTVGFGASWVIMVLCLAVFLIGARTYRAEQRVDGTPFAEAVRAWAARVFRRKNTTTDTER